MEHLKQLNPQQWQDIEPLAKLYEDLPTTLRCSPVKNNTNFRRKSPKQATENVYVCYNTPKITTFIVIDLDYDGSIFAYYDAGIPRPQFVLKNPLNGHCQYIYRLKNPVTFFKSSRQAPISLLNAVTTALNDVLGGDKAFTGYLAKNALNSTHEVYFTGAKPYTLGDLANYLDLTDLNNLTDHRADNDDFYGRNDATFHTVRKQAYAIAFKCNYTQIYNQCLAWCEEYNTRYSRPLRYNEIKSISKSIAGYCTGQRFRREFSELQAVRGAKGGKAKGEAYKEKRQRAIELHEKGMKKKDIAEKLGVTARTLTNWGVRKKK